MYGIIESRYGYSGIGFFLETQIGWFNRDRIWIQWDRIFSITYSNKDYDHLLTEMAVRSLYCCWGWSCM